VVGVHALIVIIGGVSTLLITGATDGLGRALAGRAHDDDWTVLAHGRMVRDAGIDPVSTVEQGLDATWRLIADPALDGVTGVYFNRTHEARAEAQAYDPDARRALHELSERLTG
jgi:NAD(P)-dependent dehydrogenase (short-subunit alcohol dehydrogenase family)